MYMYMYVHVHVCMYVCTPAATDCSEDEHDVSLQQLHQSLPLTGLHQIHPLTVGPLVLTKVLCGDITQHVLYMYMYIRTTAGAVGEDRVLHVYVHTVHVCISSWLALISVAYCPSAKLSVAKQPTQPQNDSTLNTTLILIHHVQIEMHNDLTYNHLWPCPSYSLNRH